MTLTRESYVLPAILLGIMFALMLASARGDSATMDELAHVPAGYSYVFLRDYRLNPEHPPLMKMLAALPLALAAVRFPTDVKSWTDDVNGQWDQGRIFLYESGNDADRILRLMRLPMMLLALLLGWLLWAWARRHFGERVALLTLFLYSFSPTFLAHSRYVTTDLAAAFGFFIGIIAFLRFLKRPSPPNVLLLGVAFGVGQLLKFSLVLLIPVYAVLLAAWAAAQIQSPWPERARTFIARAAQLTIALAVGVAVIWLGYAYPIANYPPERHVRDAELTLASLSNRPAAEFDLWLTRNDLTRPIGQYLLGLLMVIQRSAGGNTQYFWGEVAATAFPAYFPLLYLLKETLALHVLALVALAAAIVGIARAGEKSPARALDWVRNHFIEFAALAFIAVYWATSIRSNLNIGLRHMLPTFPFIYLLVSKGVITWARLRSRRPLVYLLVGWMAVSVIATFPHFLSYYNALGGGTDGGWRIGVDSNYDWGQDLKRLQHFAEREGVANIRVDYFGGGSPAYYLGDKFEPWSSAKGYPPGGGWYAVSATFRMGAYGLPGKGFVRKPEDSYAWLKPFEPVARAGKSIFIYRLPEEPPTGLLEQANNKPINIRETNHLR